MAKGQFEPLAALRSKSDDKHEGASQIALSWKHLGEGTEAAHRYEADAAFPAGMRIVASRKPAWSADGADVFLGFAAWDEKAPAAKKDAEEQAGVDVWHWRDADVMPKQKKSAAQDRRRNMLAVWHVDENRLVPLGHDLTGQLVPLKNQKLAYATEWKSYAMERSIGRPAADLSLVDLATGAATKIKDQLTDDRYLQASPGGRYLLYSKRSLLGCGYRDARGGQITKNIKTSLIDHESDETVKQKPPFGVAGWTKNDAEVILYDKFDLWKISADGAHAARLTDGAADENSLSLRAHWIRMTSPSIFDSRVPEPFGVWSKKSGYAVWAGARLRSD